MGDPSWCASDKNRASMDSRRFGRKADCAAADAGLCLQQGEGGADYAYGIPSDSLSSYFRGADDQYLCRHTILSDALSVLFLSFQSLPKTATLDSFMKVLQQDIQAARSAVERYHFQVQNIYIGGGTPTALPDSYFADMLQMVYNAFYGPEVEEFTVEAGRPDSITTAKIDAMVRLQVSRVSVNPQTMQQRTLHIIGRRHTPEDVVQMYHSLRQAGIRHINMDLILGLPGESVSDVRDTVEKVLALHPDDITLHALAIKRGSKLKHLMEEQHVDLPDDEETRQMSETAMALLFRRGYHPYYLYRQGYMAGDLENLGCCRPGAEGMYNIQIMEEHQTILGIGGAAATKVVDFAENG